MEMYGHEFTPLSCRRDHNLRDVSVTFEIKVMRTKNSRLPDFEDLEKNNFCPGKI